MKRCKYCGAICTENGCPNSTCIAYTKTEVTPKKRKTKKVDADNADTIEADIKR